MKFLSGLGNQPTPEDISVSFKKKQGLFLKTLLVYGFLVWFFKEILKKRKIADRSLMNFWNYYRRFLIILGLVAFSVRLEAAYRVYQLKVTPMDERNRPLKAQTVLSTLNQFQYENYHGYGKMRVLLMDSWYCPGDTSQEDYCPKPKNKNLQRGPAGLFAPKRKGP